MKYNDFINRANAGTLHHRDCGCDMGLGWIWSHTDEFSRLVRADPTLRNILMTRASRDQFARTITDAPADWYAAQAEARG